MYMYVYVYVYIYICIYICFLLLFKKVMPCFSCGKFMKKLALHGTLNQAVCEIPENISQATKAPEAPLSTPGKSSRSASRASPTSPEERFWVVKLLGFLARPIFLPDRFGGFQKWGTPIAGWFIMENTIEIWMI